MGRDRQVDQGQLLQQFTGPAVAASDDASRAPDGSGQTRRLGVHHARRKSAQLAVPALLEPAQSPTHLIGKPAIQLSHAGRNPLGAAVSPLLSSERGRYLAWFLKCRLGPPGLPNGGPN